MTHRPRSIASLTRVLVTDGEERSALAIVRSLGRARGYEPQVCSCSGRSLAGASRYSRAEHKVGDPLIDPEGFARRLATLCGEVSADVLMPVSEASLRAVLSRRSLFGDVIIPFPTDDQFRRISEKSEVLDIADEIGIAIPRQHTACAKSDVFDLLDNGQLAFPLVIKPARSVVNSGRSREKVGVSYAADESELVTGVEGYGSAAYPLLLQQRVVGPGIGVFLLRWNGETVAAFSHRRLREKPPSGGVSVYSESIALDPHLLESAEALLQRFDWSGVAMVEFKVDAATGTPYLMEVNGRFWGSLQLAISAGVDFPRLLLTAALGNTPERVSAYRVGVRNRWWWGEVDHLLTRLRRSKEELSLPPGSPSRARAIANFLRWHPADHYEVLQFDDFGPFVRETRLRFRSR